MRAIRLLPARLRTDESGLTLIEVLVAAPLATMLIFATMTLYMAGVSSQSRTASRSESLTQQRLGLERITRELRPATTFLFVSSQVIEFDSWIRPPGGSAVQRRVRIDCSESSSCTRTGGPKGGPVSGQAAVLITDVQNSDIFLPSPNFLTPNYVDITLRVRVKGETRTITMRDGVDLRNLTTR